MYLKTLTIRGFKSFASVTTFEFEPGVTAVVGPNGSGKSNVVDALAWVMGEQGAKSLRGASMEDVIFAGTSTRQPLGRASVSLTIDNSDGVLPIEYAEVTISRTMFRSGGSEYTINGSKCRLLDIQELLSDSGLGREMHVIVGQGQLDQVLHASAEQRRGFIEEAAGVLKHRRRRERTVRKLDSLETKLERLNDLVTETSRQLAPLGKQASVARRAQRIQYDVRDALSRIIADDLITASTALHDLHQRNDADQQLSNTYTTQIHELDSQINRHDTQHRGYAERIEEFSSAYHQLSRHQERLNTVISVAQERSRSLQQAADAAETSGPDPERAAQQAVEYRAQAEALDADLTAATQSLEAANAARETAEHQHRVEDKRFTDHLSAQADQRAGLATLKGRLSTAENQLHAATTREHRAHAQQSQDAETLQSYQSDIDDSRGQLEHWKSQLPELEREHQRSRDQLEDSQRRHQEATQEHRRVEVSLRSHEARLAGLQASQASADASEKILNTAELPSAQRFVSALTVERGYDQQIAHALGSLDQALCVADAAAAETIMTWLLDNDAGRVHLVIAEPEHPTDSAEPKLSADSETSEPARATAKPVDSPSAEPAALTHGRWAAELVSTSDQYRGFIDRVLMGVAVVDTAEEAHTLLRDTPAHTVITAIGEVLRSQERIGGTANASSELALDAERARVAEDITVEERALSQAAKAENRLAAETADLQTATSVHSSALRDVHAEIKTTTAALERSRRDYERALTRSSGAQTEISAAAEAAQKAQELIDDLAARIKAAENQHLQESEPSSKARDKRAAEAATARQAEVDARLHLRATEDQRRQLLSNAEDRERAASAQRRRREQTLEQAASKRQAAQAALEIADDGRSYAVQITDTLAAISADLEKFRVERGHIDATLEQLRSQRAGQQRELAAVNERVQKSELQQAQYSYQLESAEQRGHEELSLSAEYLLENYSPDQPVPAPVPQNEDHVIAYDRAEQESRLAAARKDLKSLGAVNPLALEEYAALEERHRYLHDQLTDVQNSREDLRAIIAEVDQTVQELFTSAWQDTAAQFEHVFSRLFPGGEGRLELTDPQDMLNTGIEVHARPAGKRVRRLSLLSGGERSLTAVALLVAIFKARPSPFYVMDEVEAALDDTNLSRLLVVFAELRESSQLIVITHQKRTMEIADALYGVSMRGDGATRVISQRLESS